MAARRLIDYVPKTHKNAFGFFAEASDDLGDLKIPEVPPMVQMAYAYARRTAAAGLYYQNIFTHDQFMYVHSIFQAYQFNTGHTVEFQEEANDQALEFLQSYDSRLTKQVTALLVAGALTAGSHNQRPGAPINSVDWVFNTARRAMSGSDSQSESPRSENSSLSSSGGKKEGCYIATRVYGSYDHPQVLVLRRFRDNVLKKNFLGQKFIALYYRHSPRVAEMMKGHSVINAMVRFGLDGFILLIRIFSGKGS